MATVTYYVDAPSGAGTTDGSSLANAFASIEDVWASGSWASGDDLVIELNGGEDATTGTILIQYGAQASCSLRVRESTYRIKPGAGTLTSNAYAMFWRGQNVAVDGDYALVIDLADADSSARGLSTDYVLSSGHSTPAGLAIINCSGSYPHRGYIDSCEFDNWIVHLDTPGGRAVNPLSGTGVIRHLLTNGYVDVDGGTVTATNCYASEYQGTLTLNTCASGDTSGSAGLQNIAFSTVNFESVSLSDLFGTYGVPKGTSALAGGGTATTVTNDYAGNPHNSPPDVSAAAITSVSTTHNLSGTLTLPSVSLTGAFSHALEHNLSGTLALPSVSLAGVFSHTGPPVTHDLSGTLTLPAVSLSGVFQHLAPVPPPPVSTGNDRLRNFRAPDRPAMQASLRSPFSMRMKRR